MELGFIMIVPVLAAAMGGAAALVWWERRLLGFWQDQIGRASCRERVYVLV